MSTKKWLAGITAGIIGLSAIGATAYAKNRHGDRGERMVERVTERLSLNEGQVASLQALQLEFRETRDAMQNDRAATMDQIGGLLSAESFDQDAALQLINARIAAVQTNAPDLVSAAAVFLDNLTSEQKAQIQEFIDTMGQRRHGRGH